MALLFAAACGTDGSACTSCGETGETRDDSGPPDTGDTDTGAIPPPDPDWRLTTGPRYVADEAYDGASYSLAVGAVDGVGTPGILVGTPHNAEDYSPPPPGPYPWHDGAFLLTVPFEGGVIPNVATATLAGYTEGVARGIGGAVGFVGDVTNDGEPDLGVTGEYPDRMSLVIFSGPHAGSRTWEDADAAFTYEAYGGFPAQTPGGDLDGDGIDDLLLTGGGTTKGGGALVLFGPLTGQQRFDDTWDIFVHAPIGENFGEPLAAWDQDGDGATDLVASATYTDDFRGRVCLFAALGPGSRDIDDADAEWTGEVAGGYAGQSIASGDLDGDGAPDLFIGAPLADGRTGRAYVVLDSTGGRLADAPITFTPRHASDWLGQAAAVGDFDGDGQDDLAIGAPRDSYFTYDWPGRAIVFRGPLEPGAYDEDTADAIWLGSELPDSFGMRLLAADLDLDGSDELVVGAPWDGAVGVEAGSVTVLFDVLAK